MTVYKYIQSRISDFEEKKYSFSDLAQHKEDTEFYNQLKEMDENTTVEQFCSAMEMFNHCPTTFYPDYTCLEDDYYQGCCESCWYEFLKKRLKPFRQLEFYQLLHSKNAEAEIKTIRSKEYLDWIYHFFDNPENHAISSETLLYSDNKTDSENASLLHVFNLYVEDLTAENNKCKNLSDGKDYEVSKYQFKIRDKFFEISLFVGQGSIIYITLLDEEPDFVIEL